MKSCVLAFFLLGPALFAQSKTEFRPLDCSSKCYDFDYFFFIAGDVPPSGYEYDFGFYDPSRDGNWYLKHENDPNRLCIYDIDQVPSDIRVARGATSDPAGSAWRNKMWPMRICLQNGEWANIKATNDSAAGWPCAETLNTNDFQDCMVNATYQWESFCNSMNITPLIKEWYFVGDCDKDVNTVKLMARYDPTAFYDDPNQPPGPGDPIRLAVVVQTPAIVFNGATTTAEYHIIPFQVPEAQNPKHYSTYPAFEINVSTDFYGRGYIWSTACPCLETCTRAKCKNICKTLTHELGHMYGLSHTKPGYPSSYSDDDLMAAYYKDPPCNAQFSENDHCYFCKMYCPNDCADIVGISIDEENIAHSLSVHCFPNPTNDILIVNIESKQNENIRGYLYDLSGRIVYRITNESRKLVNGPFILDLKSLRMKRGVYFIVFDNGEDVSSAKIILH